MIFHSLNCWYQHLIMFLWTCIIPLQHLWLLQNKLTINAGQDLLIIDRLWTLTHKHMTTQGSICCSSSMNQCSQKVLTRHSMNNNGSRWNKTSSALQIQIETVSLISGEVDMQGSVRVNGAVRHSVQWCHRMQTSLCLHSFQWPTTFYISLRCFYNTTD